MAIMAWLGLSVLLPVASVAATFSVSVDHTTTGSDHTLQLAARLEGNSDDFNLDITPLEKDFYVTAKPDLQRAGAWREKHYRLGAKHHGRVNVPALKVMVDGKKLLSQPFQINILATDGDVDDVRLWVKDSLGTRKAWVRQQLAWQMKVFSTYPFTAAPEIQLPAFKAFDVRKVDAGIAGNVVKNGRRLFTMSWHYLLYPRHAGDLHITQPVVTARLSRRVKTHRFASGNPNFDAGETRFYSKKARGSAQHVRVNALPAAAAKLPVGQLALSSDMPDAHIYASEPLTWNIHFTGTGVRRKDMPTLWQYLALDDALKAVRETPIISVRKDGFQMKVEALYRLVLTPAAVGTLQLPAIEIAFFNPGHGRIEHARLAARTLQVLPSQSAQGDESFEIAAAGKHHERDQQHDGASGWWKALAIGMFILWLATLAAWIYWGRRGVPLQQRAPLRQRKRPPALRKVLNASDAATQFPLLRDVLALPERITPLGLLAFFPDLHGGGDDIAAWLAALEQGRWRHGAVPPALDEKHVREMIRIVETAIQANGEPAATVFDAAKFGRIGG